MGRNAAPPGEKLSRRLSPTLLGIIAVMVLFGTIAVYGYVEASASFARVLADVSVGGSLREEFQRYADRENGLRGYTTTHDRRFLDPYTRAQVELLSVNEEVSNKLRTLGLTDAVTLHEKIGHLQETWEAEVATHLLANPEGTDALTWQLRGKDLMDQTRVTVDSIRAIIAHDRDGTSAQTRARTLTLAVAAIVLGLMLTAIAAWLEYRRETSSAIFTKALEDRAKELERSNAALQDFAYAASHDLQEPLRMVSSYTQLLSRRYKGKLDADADEFIAFAVDGAKRMETLIKDLLAYSRVGSQMGELDVVDSRAAYDGAIANLRVAIDESGARVDHGALPLVLGNASQLALVLQNLLGNALKYRGERSPVIRVDAYRSGSDWQFSVADNGIGIEPRHYDRVFRMFGRLHTRGEYPGTGIGLALVKRIVELHGGSIWVESTPGVGSTFFFTMAAAPAGAVVSSVTATADDRDLARRG